MDTIKTEICSNFHFDRTRIIFGIDLSASNEWQGRKTFQGQSLHKTQSNKIYNPYQKVEKQKKIIHKNSIFYYNLGY